MIVRLLGGLGNQFFQYAMARNYEISEHKEITFDLSDYEKDLKRSYGLHHFCTKLQICSDEKKLNRYGKIYALHCKTKKLRWLEPFYKVFIEKNAYIYQDVADYEYVVGYWQNCKYFERIQNELKKELTSNIELNAVQKECLLKIQTETSIMLHVRRGDYLSPVGKKVYCSLDEEYYQRAVECLKKEGIFGSVYVFSDDIEWCRQHLGFLENHIFVDRNISGDTYVDFELMRNCKHFIIANSTFSWWASWLSDHKDKKIVSPRNWFYDGKMNEDIETALLSHTIRL